MGKMDSPGKRFKQALIDEKPLQVMGTVNAYCALMAERVGYRAMYLSGGACANASYGLPDLGLTSLDDVLADVQRITRVCKVPLLVDIDTGWENDAGIAHTISEMSKAGAAAVQLEDQVSDKRCGHLDGKTLVSTDEMVARIQAAVSAKIDPDFVVMARTDAFANEGMQGAVDRANAYVKAGADALFAEALTELDHYREFCDKVNAPVLANITEFGKTPLFTVEELRDAGVAMVLYPFTALRAMNQAAFTVYETVRKEGTQQSLLESMQDRETLYDFLNYQAYEDNNNN